MLPKPLGGTPAAAFATQDANGNTFEAYSAQPSTQTRCVVAQGLTSCPKVNGQSVQILSTNDMMMVDLAAQDAINFGLNSADIMSSAPTQACQDAYRDMICATHFIPCGAATATICQTSCQKTNQVCTFNQTLIDGLGHDSMYDCTQQTYQQLYADANGMCSGAPAAIAGNDLNNSATSYAQPMMIVTLLISFIGMIFH